MTRVELGLNKKYRANSSLETGLEKQPQHPKEKKDG
jgi:hypothetical protein